MEHGHHHGGDDKGRRPYWKHAHRDWRFWVAVFFIFAAIFVYVVSDDLALVPRGHRTRPQPVSNGGP